jgi:hypothetical protein
MKRLEDKAYPGCPQTTSLPLRRLLKILEGNSAIGRMIETSEQGQEGGLTAVAAAGHDQLLPLFNISGQFSKGHDSARVIPLINFRRGDESSTHPRIIISLRGISCLTEMKTLPTGSVETVRPDEFFSAVAPLCLV